MAEFFERDVWFAKVHSRESTLDPEQLETRASLALGDAIEWMRGPLRLSLLFNFWHEGSQVRGGVLGYDHTPPPREEDASTGPFACFVFHGESRLFAWEERPEVPGRAVLETARDLLRRQDLTLRLLVDLQAYEDWLDDVETVTQFEAELERPPNPGWRKLEEELRDASIGDAVEATAASYVDFRLGTEAAGGLTTRETFLEAVAAQCRRGDGAFRVAGYKGPSRVFFSSEDHPQQGQMTVAAGATAERIAAQLVSLIIDLTSQLHPLTTPG